MVTCRPMAEEGNAGGGKGSEIDFAVMTFLRRAAWSFHVCDLGQFGLGVETIAPRPEPATASAIAAERTSISVPSVSAGARTAGSCLLVHDAME